VKNLLISAIIPTYNRAAIITDAVDSVLAQTYQTVEVLVVDDGSADDTQARLARYGNRIRVIRQENAGPASARNRGIAASRGSLIAFLDSDDLWLPTKLERQAALLEQAGDSVPCCLCNISMRWRERELGSFETASLNPPIAEGLWLNPAEVLATRFLLFNQGIVIRREVLERIGGFDERLWLLEDHELALRLSLEGSWAFIRDRLVIWRETTMGSLYQTAQKEQLRVREPLVQILEKHLAKVQGGNQQRSLQRYVWHELTCARGQLRAAKFATAKSWSTSILGNSLRKLEQYRRALFVRSPWFPKMKVESLSGRAI
jgi:glycosyltransferase involved in cell wall biosynthesis